LTGIPGDSAEPARALGPALLFALLALPCDPGWIDFELARRGVLLLLAGVLACGGPRWCPAARPAGLTALGLLCGLYLLRSVGVLNPAEGLLRAAHWIALTLLFVFGASRRPLDILRALVPVGVLVAVLGTAQALGLDFPAGAARPDQAVATLGNRNVASEFASMAFAAAAGLTALGRARAPTLVGMLVIGLYLGLNGTRAGYVAALGATAAAGLATRALPRPRAVSRLALLAGLAAVLAGALWRPPAAATAEVPEPGPIAAARQAPSTLEVRFELWRGGLGMLGDAPLLGHGSGQFRYAYPAYRTEREIELSTFGRRFPTFASTVHDDPLEVGIELGALGLLLALAFALSAGRRIPRPAGLALAAPLVAFALGMLVRSPIGNAPAAAAAFALLGALAGDAERSLARPSIRRGLASVGLGLGLAAAGVAILAASSSAARWLGGGPDAWLDRAVASHGSESRYRSLRIQARCGGLDEAGLLARRGPAELAACREDLAALARLDPNNTNALFLAAQLAHGGGDREAARVALGRILSLDPREPRAQLLAAVLAAEDGRAADAVGTLYANPHPVLRARIAATLAALAARPQSAAQDRRLLETEARFVAALDAVLADPTGAIAQRAVLAFAAADPGEARARALLARIRLAEGRDPEAAALAPEHFAPGSAIRELMAEVLGPLRALPAWAAALEG
jgi:O-antigen ligase